MEAILDYDYFVVSPLDYLSKSDIDDIREKMNEFEEPKHNFEWMEI